MKVTDLFVIIFVITAPQCKPSVSVDSQLAFQQSMDSVAGKSIDSAYAAIHDKCDSLTRYKLPQLVDSMLRMDTAYLLKDNISK